MDPYLFQFLTGLALGFPTSLHCVSMCGGIMAALGLSTPAKVRGAALEYGKHAGAMNLGRVLVYSLAGALAGLGGLGAISLMQNSGGHFILRVLAGLTLLFVGFSLLGVAGFTEFLNRLMAPVSKPLARLGRALNRLRGLGGAFAKGMIWAFLPCGLVYSALVYAALSGSPGRGAAVMAGFGLATIPALILTAFGARSLVATRNRLWLSRAAGLLIIGFAIATYMGVDAQIGALVCKTPP